MEIKEVITALQTLFSLLGDSRVSVWLSAVGLLLLIAMGCFIWKAIKSTPAEFTGWWKAGLFVCLSFGIIFSLAGPAVSLLNVGGDRSRNFANGIIKPEQA